MHDKILFVLTLCLGLIAPTLGQLSEWGYRGQLVNCVKNHILTNHVVQVTSGVSRLRCVARCFSVPSCQSVNYATGIKECHLSDVQRAVSAAGDYQKSTEFEYCGPDTNEEWEKTPKHFGSISDTQTTSLPTTAKPTTDVAQTTVATETTTTPVPTTQDITTITESQTTTEVPTTTELIAGDCDTLANHGMQSGVHEIYTTEAAEAMKVFCDINGDGGWIVIQRRKDGTEDFNRSWVNYKYGFGDLESEFWFGNLNIRTLTSSGTWRLRIELLDWEGETAWAEYDSFSLIGGWYTLIIGNYSGNASDALSYHSGVEFSTVDYDNYKSCAASYLSGWWFDFCLKSNLNGVYYQSNPVEFNQGLQWDGWKNDLYSLKASVMKIRKA